MTQQQTLTFKKREFFLKYIFILQYTIYSAFVITYIIVLFITIDPVFIGLWILTFSHILFMIC